MDKAVENADDLAHFLAGSIGYWDDVLEDVARWIFLSPRQHIEALVEAGVLERFDERATGALPVGVMYAVVQQPHKHEWWVSGYAPSFTDPVSVMCNCGERRQTHNRPIEVPGD